MGERVLHVEAAPLRCFADGGWEEMREGEEQEPAMEVVSDKRLQPGKRLKGVEVGEGEGEREQGRRNIVLVFNRYTGHSLA